VVLAPMVAATVPWVVVTVVPVRAARVVPAVTTVATTSNHQHISDIDSVEALPPRRYL